MNRIFGYLSFHHFIEQTLIEKTKFKNFLWAPDHVGCFINNSIALTSTQRFITPECHHAPMPFLHKDSGCYIVADVYLTNRIRLCSQLQVCSKLADAELILLAYLKWGADVSRYLSGEFCFAIWDPSDHALLLATDQFSKRPLIYSYKPGHSFTFSNEFSPFSSIASLTINENMFAHLALDSLPGEETCYKDIFKLLPGHQLHVTPNGMKKTCYWRLQDHKKVLPCKTREEYYETFRYTFQNAVKNALRSQYPITAHISGGLDSSSVAAQAAVLLKQQQRPLLSCRQG